MPTGARVRLRPVERADLPRFVAWLQDDDVITNLDIVIPFNTVREEKFFDDVMAGPPETQPFSLEVRKGRGWLHVGGCGLQHADWRNRSIELGIFIGVKEAWGRGYGTEATQLLVDHAFGTLNMHRVWLRNYEDNRRARHVYEELGFVLEGRQRDGDYRAGRYRDVLLLSILRPEWERRAARRRRPARGGRR
jgi:RimJ/RimL family protein N-acetyltransferase